VREFVMKDSYSLDIDRAGLDHAFQLHFDAYRKIFERCGLAPLAVEASSGAMGGSESIEFMVASDAGEDWVASCGACGYGGEPREGDVAARRDRRRETDRRRPRSSRRRACERSKTWWASRAARRRTARSRRSSTCWMPQRREAPGPPSHQVALVLLRGDHALSEQKLCDATGTLQARPATNDEIRAALGASAGSLGAVGSSRACASSPTSRSRVAAT
jgi:prolyl-tRNA synthetase